MSTKTVEEQLADAKAQLEALKAKVAKAQTISLKVSEKGAVSVYGLGRFPCTLYSQQMLRLLDHGPQIRAFIEENKSKLAVKE